MTADRPSPARPGRWILVAVVVVIGFVLVFPGLWPFVAAGAVAAVTIELASSRWSAPPAARGLWRKLRRPLAVAAGALGLAAGALSVGYLVTIDDETEGGAPGFVPFEIAGAYTATVTLADDAHRLAADEQLTLAQEELTRAIASAEPNATAELIEDLQPELRLLGVRDQRLGRDPLTRLVPLPPDVARLMAERGLARVDYLLAVASDRELDPRRSDALVRWVRRVGRAVIVDGIDRDLAAQGWRLARETSVRRRYEREHEGPLNVSAVIPARRRNDFRVRGFDSNGEAETGRAVLRLDESATVTLVAPDNALGDVYPSSRGRQSRVAADVDEVTVALADARAGVVEFDVRSPPFRGPPLSWLLGASLWSPLKWLIALLVTLASDTVREWLRRMLTGAWRRIRPPGRPARAR